METQPTIELLPIGEVDGVLTVSSIDFALGLGINHKSLLETIRNNKEAIEGEFGLIAFETRKSADSPVETANLSTGKKSTKPFSVALLTEEQALFTGTLSKNSKRVVAFKATLVRSFAEARKRLLQAAQAVVPLKVEEVLLQQAHRLVDQQNQIDQLRDEVAQIMSGHKPPRPTRRTLAASALPPHQKQAALSSAPKSPSSLRASLVRRINEYCGYHRVTQQETYHYLYRQMFDVFRVDVWQLVKAPGDSLLDAVERYGHLERLYSLVMAELAYPDETIQAY